MVFENSTVTWPMLSDPELNLQLWLIERMLQPAESREFAIDAKHDIKFVFNSSGGNYAHSSCLIYNTNNIESDYHINCFWLWISRMHIYLVPDQHLEMRILENSTDLLGKLVSFLCCTTPANLPCQSFSIQCFVH